MLLGPFCPVDTVLLFTVFYGIVSVSMNKIFIHSTLATRSNAVTYSSWPAAAAAAGIVHAAAK